MTEPTFEFLPKRTCDLCDETADLISLETCDDFWVHICSSCLKRAHAFLLKAVAEAERLAHG